ncbi:MAG: hypothetical protein H6822_05540 [Planctomycetaceae bacterium]|nr:hypothetical protein [Planctomycetales bacterium]MCB9921621.1 hypothetical protein [Planctomycetaceae bacterium]
MASAVTRLPRGFDSAQGVGSSPSRAKTGLGPRITPAAERSSREQLVVHFQRLRDETLPEMERIERMLTRVAIAYGLQYCHLDAVAESFLALSRNVRRQLVETRKAVLSDDLSSRTLSTIRSETAGSLKRFRHVITSDLTCQDATPIYRRLIDALTTFETHVSQTLEVGT